MRKLVLTAVLSAAVAAPAMAQGPMDWKTEIGIKSNYSVTTIDEADITTIGLPGGNGLFGFGGVSSLYGVVPVGKSRFAVEPSLGLSDLGGDAVALTSANVSVRALFSAWRGLYVGAGPTMALLKQGGDQETVFGVNVGAGYRFPITGNLVGRGEVFYETTQESDIIGDNSASTYGLVLGLGLTPGDVERAGSANGDRLWDMVFGIQSGYAHTSGDGFEVTALSFPGGQGSVNVGAGVPLPGIAPIFAIIPVGNRFAVEPSLAYSSVDLDGSSKISTYAVGLRANYAFNKVLYAAVSGDYQGFGGDIDADASTGFGAAFGARFPIVGGFSGRTEVTWRDFSGDENFIGDYTVTGLSFAIMAPLK